MRTPEDPLQKDLIQTRSSIRQNLFLDPRTPFRSKRPPNDPEKNPSTQQAPSRTPSDLQDQLSPLTPKGGPENPRRPLIKTS
ncbi:hypothetical protein EYF80_066379 [Liparis tanakae]|uniref:Uncharacterized protein n=1 Tax=Liparis tanakae TaxID=230148 RepID=A0A4Z2E4K3_9TELE|nr:hypothetical protein EYF80_066379 [Liparis tanakae]